ncbi:ATPase [Candidatus Nitrosacidococcus sp. I8]|uniref:ATPase n=1 Tax=Candidatus Nitrosacidococcus sp. I8 TaxID=2942908 RepID=UPI002227B2D6|nr:ATPase [Candidatus Nitrosacidococcus sp. I8]CAH9017925.1 hypothetical protein NURINAE_00629 [Candidatus Nitrosacidococcus sp. I8]
MKFTVKRFKDWKNKAITLLGMSGVGKTYLASMLYKHNWFHYSGDYRIGARYLDESILDNIKQQMIHIPFLRDLLRSDSIHIRNNITVDNLSPVSSFLGKLGNPELGGLGLKEFKRRQELHRQAEIAAMKDVPEFIHKSRSIYGYQHFINDAGGSISELNDASVLTTLAQHTLILYIKTTEKNEQALIKRAEEYPKPLYFRDDFLDEQLAQYSQEKELPYVALIDPDEFARWVFPRLFYARLPRYQAVADSIGYTITTNELAEVNDERSFLQLLETAIARQA